MVVSRAAVAFMFMLLGACSVGEVPSGGGTDGGAGGDPSQAFLANVAPQVGRCTGAACHSGVQGPNLTSYAALEARYKTKAGAMILVSKLGDGAPHQTTTYFTATEKAAVMIFINSLP